MATDWAKLTVADLRVELKHRGLPQSGKKADLVDRLATDEIEQRAKEDEQESEEAADTAKEDEQSHNSPPPESMTDLSAEPVSSAQRSELPENTTDSPVPQRVVEDCDASEPPKPITESLSPTKSTPREEDVSDARMEDVASAEDAPLVPDLASDAQNRKRRSRSPPPSEDEATRKRARPSNHDLATGKELNRLPSPSRHEESLPPSDVLGGKDVSYAIVHPEIPEPPPEPERSQAPHIAENAEIDGMEESVEERNREHQISPSRERRTEPSDDRMEEDLRDVAPAEHPATSALYIKNFMRPLKEQVLRDYLIELAAPRGSEPDPDTLVDFYLDQIRTHAFVQFTGVTCASRVRTGLHGKIWPNERNRKELFVDFIPPGMLREWVDREQGTKNRWEVRFEPDDQGRVTARLVNVDVEPRRPVARPQPSAAPIPSGPARQFPGVEGAPLGPRGRGVNHRPPAFAGANGPWRTTEANPPLLYKPASEELAQQRLSNIRFHYTKDKYRDHGHMDEINRYTFEHSTTFVDRGKEVYVGIRPPHRERQGGFGGGPRGPPPSRPRGDRYGSGWRDEPPRRNESFRRDELYRREEPRYNDPARNVPRSRLDGAPLPTFVGGGNSRPGRRGGRRGDRY